MMPAQVQQIEREIAHLESRASAIAARPIIGACYCDLPEDECRAKGHDHQFNAVEKLRSEVRRKWLMIKPFVTAGQIRLKDAARNG